MGEAHKIIPAEGRDREVVVLEHFAFYGSTLDEILLRAPERDVGFCRSVLLIRSETDYLDRHCRAYLALPLTSEEFAAPFLYHCVPLIGCLLGLGGHCFHDACGGARAGEYGVRGVLGMAGGWVGEG